MAEIQDLLATDASNVARWPENMPFSGVNDAGRADEGILARWYKDTDGSITASGSSNAFAITSNRTISSLFNNLVMAFTANFSITGATTLNLNGLGAKGLKRFNGNDLATGDIVSGQPIFVVYKSSPDVWYAWSALPALTGNTFVDLSENATPGTPATDVARLHAKDDGVGVTRLYWVDSGGTSRILLDGAATAAVMEAATATASGVTPALQHRHPGHPKAWAKGNQVGVQSLDASYGVTSITDVAIGQTRITMTTAMSSVNYGITGMFQATGGSLTRLWPSISPSEDPTTTTYVIGASNNDSNFIDAKSFNSIVVGDQ
jgi:hypothetical protein